MKKAFTLLEMLVVVGIVTVLMAIILVNVRGATDAANATKCMSNMRNLFNAANEEAIDGGYYPLAGTCIRIGYVEAGKNSHSTRTPQPAWISGDSAGNTVPCYGSGSELEDMYALTNGTIWFKTKSNADIYRCPVFVKDHLVKRKRKPVFTYAMNGGAFGSDQEFNYQSFAGAGIVKYGGIKRADRTAMFAELPISQSCSYDPLAKPDTCNSSLQFKKNLDGKTLGINTWKGRSESIGFVHQDKRKKYFGHVVFADGHVERYMQPPKGSTLKEDELTAYICSGKDCAYDERGYRYVGKVSGN